MAKDTAQDYAAQIADRQAIHDCLVWNVQGADFLDADMWKSTYWPDAEEDHGWFIGNAHQFIDETVVAIGAQMDMSWHQLGNELIEIDGSRARVLCYFYAYCRMIGADGKRSDSFTGGRYIDRFEKRDGRWKIRYRITKPDWVRFEEDSFSWGSEAIPGFVPKLGTRGPDDPARILFGRVAATGTAARGGAITPPW